MEVEEGGRK
jgi:hypothetical protein